MIGEHFKHVMCFNTKHQTIYFINQLSRALLQCRDIFINCHPDLLLIYLQYRNQFKSISENVTNKSNINPNDLRFLLDCFIMQTQKASIGADAYTSPPIVNDRGMFKGNNMSIISENLNQTSNTNRESPEDAGNSTFGK